MPLEPMQSKYAGMEVRYLRQLLKDINKKKNPELYDEIQSIIVAKEFQKLAREVKDPNHVKKASGKTLPGEKNRGYRSGSGFYTK